MKESAKQLTEAIMEKKKRVGLAVPINIHTHATA